MHLQSLLRHTDVVAGVLVFVLVGRFVPEWGIVAIVAGILAYFAVNRFYPPARR